MQGWLAIRGAVIISWTARDQCPGWLVERSSGVGWLVISVLVEQSSGVGWLVKVTHSLIVCCVVSNGLRSSRLEPVRFLSLQQKHPLNSAVANEDLKKKRKCLQVAVA